MPDECVPRRGGYAVAVSALPAVLFEVVGQAVGRLVGFRPMTGPGADPGEWAPGTAQWHGRVVEGAFQPVVVQQVPLDVGQVALGAGLQQGPRKRETVAQPSSVHGGLDHRPRGWRRRTIAFDQGRCAREVLRDLPLFGVLEGFRQAAIAGGRGAGRRQVLTGEHAGDGDAPVLDQLAGLRVRVRAPTRLGGEGGPVLGPDGAQDQNRPPVGRVEQGPKSAGDLRAVLRVEKVVLGLVQPHHGLRRHPVQLSDQGRRTVGLDWVPQSPAVRQPPDRLPAGPGLACR